jgi:hypothetical protein
LQQIKSIIVSVEDVNIVTVAAERIKLTADHRIVETFQLYMAIVTVSLIIIFLEFKKHSFIIHRKSVGEYE